MTDILNHDTLGSLRELGDEFFKELIPVFLESSQNQIELLRQGVLERNKANIEATAHSLKGASYGQGAQELAEICGKMEEGGREGDLAEMDELMTRLEKSYQLTVSALKKLL